MKHLRSLLGILIVFALSACRTVSTPTPMSSAGASKVTTSTVEPSNVPTETAPPPTATVAELNPTLTLAYSTPDTLPLDAQYVISATLDYGWRTLTVEQEITYPNTSSDIISELMLVVQPNWRPGAFDLTQFTWEDGQPVEGYTLEGIRLQAPLIEPLQPGEVLQLSLTYEITIPPILTSEDFGPNPFGYTSRQTNLTDWYPFVPPYIDGLGWLVHNPWYYGEHLVYPVADFEVSIRLTDTPDLSMSLDAAQDESSGLVIAASALDEGEGEVHHYHMERSRNFVWSVSPEYRVFREQAGDVTVLGYAFPYDVVPGEAAFKTTVKVLQLYSELFGPYPYKSLTMIQADFDHGMEYSGLYFLSKAFFSTFDGTAETYLVTIAAHETAHQWWFGLVGNDQALEPWLDEALCTYSEKLFFENLYPSALNWWNYARVQYYEPSGWVDSTIYNTPGYRPYRDAVYLNGALFLDDLRALVGDEAFFAFLQDYAAYNSSKLVTANDFFAILREHSEADWRDLLSEYFQETGNE